MKLQFKNQKFQSDAAKAVTDSFIGQRNAAMHEYTLDMGKDNQATFFDVVGFRNAPLNIDSRQLTENIRNVQVPAQLKPTNHVVPRDLRLTIEMETGTGKTYTYIKTMYELNRLYGWSKFIIVVPSIAIREGVCQSFNIMSEHFGACEIPQAEQGVRIGYFQQRYA